jgi:hypothetical protein
MFGGGERDRSPFGQWGFVLSAATLAVVGLLALVVAVSGGSASRGSQAPGRIHSATAAGGRDASAGGLDGCRLPAGSQQVPTSAPAADWVLVGSMAAPNSPGSIGPQRTVDGFRVCFAHSPLGALYAAANFWAAGTASSPASVYQHLAADTPSRGKVVAQSHGNANRLDSSGPVALAGFEFNSYSPSSADLSVVLQGSSGALVSVACTMVWQHGDWRYVIPPSGAPAAGQIQSLDGYVPWSDAS